MLTARPMHGSSMGPGPDLGLDELLSVLGDSHAGNGDGWDPDAWEWDSLLFQAQPAADSKAPLEDPSLVDKSLFAPPPTGDPALRHHSLSKAPDPGNDASANLKSPAADNNAAGNGEQAGSSLAAGSLSSPNSACRSLPTIPACGPSDTDSSPCKRKEQPNASRALTCPNFLSGRVPCECTKADPSLAVKRARLVLPTSKAHPSQRQKVQGPLLHLPSQGQQQHPLHLLSEKPSAPHDEQGTHTLQQSPPLKAHSPSSLSSPDATHPQAPSKHPLLTSPSLKALVLPRNIVVGSSVSGHMAQRNHSCSPGGALGVMPKPSHTVPAEQPSQGGPGLNSTGAPLPQGCLNILPKGPGNVLKPEPRMLPSNSNAKPGEGRKGQGSVPVMCQVDGCQSGRATGGLRGYHKRHKVCSDHTKAGQVICQGVLQRYCQQCGRFHPLQDFDGDRRSCRNKLMRHNALRKGKTVLSQAGAPLQDACSEKEMEEGCKGEGQQEEKQSTQAGEEGGLSQVNSAQSVDEGAGKTIDKAVATETPSAGTTTPRSVPLGPAIVAESAVAGAGPKPVTGSSRPSASGQGVCLSQSSTVSPSSSATGGCSQGSKSQKVQLGIDENGELVMHEVVEEKGEETASPPTPRASVNNSNGGRGIYAPVHGSLLPSVPHDAPFASPVGGAQPVSSLPLLGGGPTWGTESPPLFSLQQHQEQYFQQQHPQPQHQRQQQHQYHHQQQQHQHQQQQRYPQQHMQEHLFAGSSVPPGFSPGSRMPVLAGAPAPGSSWQGHAGGRQQRLVLPSLGSIPSPGLAPAASAWGMEVCEETLGPAPVGLKYPAGAGRPGAGGPLEPSAPLVRHGDGEWSMERPVGCGGAQGGMEVQFVEGRGRGGTGAPRCSPVRTSMSDTLHQQANLGGSQQQGLVAGFGEQRTVSRESGRGERQGECGGDNGEQDGGGAESPEKDIVAPALDAPSTHPEGAMKTGRLSFKLYQWSPGDFPRDLRLKIMNWLSEMPAELEGYIRPGCTYLTLRLRMSHSAWKELASVPEEKVRQLVQQSQSSPFFTRGHFTLQPPGGGLVVVGHGRVLGCASPVHESVRPAGMRPIPGLRLMHPLLCLSASAPVSTIRLCLPASAPKARLLCSFRGKYLLDVDVCQSALAALPLSPDWATGGVEGARGESNKCSCGCPAGCACACCSESSSESLGPKIEHAFLTRYEGDGLHDSVVVGLHVPALHKWGTLFVEMATATGLTSPLAVLVAGSSAHSSLTALRRESTNELSGASMPVPILKSPSRPVDDHLVPDLVDTPPSFPMACASAGLSSSSSALSDSMSCGSLRPGPGELHEILGPEGNAAEGDCPDFGTSLDQYMLSLGWLLAKFPEHAEMRSRRPQALAANVVPTFAELGPTSACARLGDLWASAGLGIDSVEVMEGMRYEVRQKLRLLQGAVLSDWRQASYQGSDHGRGESVARGCCSARRGWSEEGHAVRPRLMSEQGSAHWAKDTAGCCCSGKGRNAGTDVGVGGLSGATVEGSERSGSSSCSKKALRGSRVGSGSSGTTSCVGAVGDGNKEAVVRSEGNHGGCCRARHPKPGEDCGTGVSGSSEAQAPPCAAKGCAKDLPALVPLVDISGDTGELQRSSKKDGCSGGGEGCAKQQGGSTETEGTGVSSHPRSGESNKCKPSGRVRTTLSFLRPWLLVGLLGLSCSVLGTSA